MTILYDHQIYVEQKFGGISRYYNELMKMDFDGVKTERISEELVDEVTEIRKASQRLVSKGLRYVKRKAGFTNERADDFKIPELIIKKITNGAFDVLHPTYYSTYFLDHCSKPFVVTVYDMIQEIHKEQFYYYDQLSRNKRLLCEKAAHIISISEKTKQDLIDIFKIPEDKITTTHLASDFNRSTPQKPVGLKTIENYILFVGSRDLYKNFYFTVMSLSEVLKSDPTLKLLCTGRPFDNYELQFLKDFNLEHKVHHIFLKGDAELAWVYSNAAVFIFPSLYEGFGFPILEAFACNCPVISSTGGSLPEVAGDAAIYFDPKKLKEIQQAAHTVIYDAPTRERLIGKGRERLKHFSWEKCRRETYEVYKAIG